MNFGFVLVALIDQSSDGAIMEFVFVKRDIDEMWFGERVVSTSLVTLYVIALSLLKSDNAGCIYVSYVRQPKAKSK